MKRKKSIHISFNGRPSNVKPKQHPLRSTETIKILERLLREMYWTAKKMEEVIPEKTKLAASPELIYLLTNQHTSTEYQISRIEDLFEAIGKEPFATASPTVSAILLEAKKNTETQHIGLKRDAAIITSLQNLHQHKIDAYEGMYAFAKTLDEHLAAAFFKEAIEEVKAVEKRTAQVGLSIQLKIKIQDVSL